MSQRTHAEAGGHATGLRRRAELGALAALAGFCAFHWANLVVDPPVVRVVAVLVVVVGTAAALAWLGGRAGAGRGTLALAALIALAGAAGGLVAAGIPVRLIAPWNWDELRDGVAEGIAGLGGASYPYRADGEWPRAVLIGALPLMLGLAAWLAFWPSGRRSALRAAGLVVLLATYGAAVVLYAPGHAALHGIALLALVGLWLWGTRLAEARGVLALAMVAAAGALALPLSSAIARSEPMVDYRSWSWTGGEPTVSFDWNHSYAPLDWPREGTALLEIESDVPHYWRSVVLERFDGLRWVRSDQAGMSLELPNKVEGEFDLEHPEWIESTGVVVRELRSPYVVGPGSVQNVAGLSGFIATDGTVLAGEVPNSGQGYEVTSYAPDPSAAQLEAADEPYPPAMSRFTSLELPGLPLGTRSVVVPLRDGPGEAARAQIARSGYGGVERLARELVAGARTNYEAVLAIEQHFQSGFTYSEEPAVGDRPLRSFLLKTRTGYCQQYSGAMALMLRMVGIPARVVSGFSPGAPDLDQDGWFTVRDTDAHSWVEVYFPEIGWVPFDPTPTVSPAQLQSNPDAAAATPGRAPDRPAGRVRESETQGGVPDGSSGADDGGLPLIVPAALLALTALAAGFASARRRARFDAAPRAARLEALVCELPGAMGAAHYRAPGGTTLLALERRLRHGRRTATAEYVRGLRRCLYSARAAAQPGLRERRAARRELSRSRGLRDRLRLLGALPPGGPRMSAPPRVPAAPRG